MSEIITLPVCVGENDKELAFSYEENVITLRLDNKDLCSFDYDGNLRQVIKRMLEIWG